MIPIQCANCGKKYRAAERHAGRRLHCKICGQALRVPEPLDALDALGAESEQIIRHENRTKEVRPAVGDSACIEAITAHIEQHIGPVASVFHEVLSELVHIDIHQVHPTDDRPFYTLITSGMSDLAMAVPAEAEGCSPFAELMLCLPADWELSQEAFEDEGWYWPVRWLKMLARLPHEYATWLGSGHTIPNGDPPEPFAPNTKLCCCLVASPLTVPVEFRSLKINRAKTIAFLSVVPLYVEEVNFKLKHTAEPLVNRFNEFEITELLDIRRPNVCRRG